MGKSCVAPEYRAPESRADRKESDLHSGQWFVDQGEAQARKATWSAFRIVLIMAVIAGWLFL